MENSSKSLLFMCSKKALRFSLISEFHRRCTHGRTGEIINPFMGQGSMASFCVPRAMVIPMKAWGENELRSDLGQEITAVVGNSDVNGRQFYPAGWNQPFDSSCCNKTTGSYIPPAVGTHQAPISAAFPGSRKGYWDNRLIKPVSCLGT